MLRTVPGGERPTPNRRDDWPRLPGPGGSALGFGAAMVATVLGWLTEAGHHPATGLLALAAVAVGVGACTTVLGALAAGAQCWAMYCGFELHRFGELRLDSSSRVALVALLGLAVAASLLGLAARSGAALGGGDRQQHVKTGHERVHRFARPRRSRRTRGTMTA